MSNKAVIKLGYMSKKEFESRMRKIELNNKSKERKEKLKAEKNKFKRSKKIKTSNIVLASAIIAVVGYTVASLYIQHHTGTEVSSTLTERWFRFWTVEVAVLAGIKVTKIFKDYISVSNDDMC